MAGDPSAASSPAPPSKFKSQDDELDWYKTNYHSVVEELHDLMETSKELEGSLEQELESSEKEMGRLRERSEGLGFEVEEWRSKHKQAKEEANRAQNVLQKEITTLRDSNRALTLKLRDIEVANDDFEKQARHQTSSLEDMESKYNKAIERGVLLDEEIRNGEAEREALRIENQRLRDELSDLKVEAEINAEKLRVSEESWANAGLRKPSGGVAHINTNTAERAQSPSLMSESGASTTATTISSPTVATPPPPARGESSAVNVQTSPPSPPLSESSALLSSAAAAATAKSHPPVTPANRRVMEPGTTPRPLHSGIRPPRHSRGPSIPSVRQSGPTSAAPKRTRPSMSSALPTPGGGSKAMGQLHTLRSKMATLEQRVQRVHSRLPAPSVTPPRASPRSASSAVGGDIPSSITVRSSRKRTSASVSTAGGSSGDGKASRLSFGFNPSASTTAAESRPSSRASLSGGGGGQGQGIPRPSSRASGVGIPRPPSQSSIRTPSSLGYYPQAERRPRSSMSGTYAAQQATPGSRAGTPSIPRHGYSASIAGGGADDSLLEGDEDGGITPTARRTTLDAKGMGSSIPGPGMGRRQSAATLVRRQSNISSAGDGGGGGRASRTGERDGEMLPPVRRPRQSGVDVGETF